MHSLWQPLLILVPMVAISWTIYFFISRETENRRLQRETELEEMSRAQPMQPGPSAADVEAWNQTVQKLERRRRIEYRVNQTLLIVSFVVVLVSATAFLGLEHADSVLREWAYKLYCLGLFALIYAAFGLVTGRDFKTEKKPGG